MPLNAGITARLFFFDDQDQQAYLDLLANKDSKAFTLQIWAYYLSTI